MDHKNRSCRLRVPGTGLPPKSKKSGAICPLFCGWGRPGGCSGFSHEVGQLADGAASWGLQHFAPCTLYSTLVSMMSALHGTMFPLVGKTTVYGRSLLRKTLPQRSSVLLRRGSAFVPWSCCGDSCGLRWKICMLYAFIMAICTSKGAGAIGFPTSSM